MAVRRWLGYALIALLLMGGRGLRRAILIGPDGRWRDPLWLESILPPPVEAAVVEKPPPPSGPFDVNRAPVDTLVFLPGIGPKLAARIVASRELEGEFLNLQDLQRVKGIGPKLSARLAADVVFGPPGTQLSAAAADTSGVAAVRPAPCVEDSTRGSR